MMIKKEYYQYLEIYFFIQLCIFIELCCLYNIGKYELFVIRIA